MKRILTSVSVLLALGVAAQGGTEKKTMAPAPKLPSRPLTTSQAVVSTALQPFPMTQVRLLGGREKEAQTANGRYLLSLPVDSLLWTFRKNAGQPTPGKPLGGWEDPGAGWRGFFIGHYLSACALMYQSTGDAAFKDRAAVMVAELGKCQTALNDGGYLSAFPTSEFDDLEAGKPVPVPYYTIHKIMAGMVDVYQYCGDMQALDVVEGMAGYFKRRTDKFSDAQMATILKTEQGGIANTFYDLYGLTHNPDDLTLAHRFEHKAFLQPLLADEDELAGIHANTNIPKVLGAARRYELLDDQPYRNATAFFWDAVTNHHSYATGGSNSGEHWGLPDKLADTLSSSNQETCTSYNILKVTRDLIRWTGDPKYADFYERNYFNGILPAQRPDTGMMIYYLPLEAGNIKHWGGRLDAFWCCYGTGVESFAKLQDSVYFHDAGDGLYVNLYVPSELTWAEKRVRLTQQTRFPEAETSTFTIHAARPTHIALHLHVPYWAAGYKITVNGRPFATATRPTSYAVVSRTWREGDTVGVTLPMALHTKAMPDDPTMQAVMYGPLVLAGVMDGQTPRTADRQTTGELRVASPVPTNWLKPVPGRPLMFRTVGQAHDTTFIPLYQIIDQPYGVYWSLLTPGSARDRQLQALAATHKDEDARRVDAVQPNDAASEKAHDLVANGSNSGTGLGRGWRDGASFGWTLKILPDQPMTLRCTYWGDDFGRTFDILVNGQKIATETLAHSKPGKFYDVDYPLAPALTANNANAIVILFQAHHDSNAGGVFNCATLKPAPRIVTIPPH